jgi:hypothetical protein
MGFRTPSPGQTNNGSMNCEGARCVSLTRFRMEAVDRSRRKRVAGNAILRIGIKRLNYSLTKRLFRSEPDA